MKVLLIDDNPSDQVLVIESLGAVFPKAQYVEVAQREAFDAALMHAAFDISARLQLEGEMRQSQKMQALGAFARGIAHDFNNILGVVLGYAELTELILDHPSERHTARENLRQIRVAGERVRDIVRQILTFSRQTNQQRQPLQLRFLIKETLTLLRAALPTTITLMPKLDTYNDIVLADSTQMHQVLLNLCANAEHAMRETGGVLEIGLEAIDLPPGAPPPIPTSLPEPTFACASAIPARAH